MPSTVGSIEHARPVPAAEREQFDRDGYLIIRGALAPDEVRRYADALDQVYAAATTGGRVRDGASLHQLSAVANCPEAAGLLDHPATFRYVWSLLGWNIHVYHSHLDVHPPLPTAAAVGEARLLAVRRVRAGTRQPQDRPRQPPDQLDFRATQSRHRMARPRRRD